MPVVAPRRRRARPVVDAPINALLLRSEDLAKGWLLALLEDAPLEEASRILAAELTRDGPRLCDAVLRAIGDDTLAGAVSRLRTALGATRANRYIETVPKRGYRLASALATAEVAAPTTPASESGAGRLVAQARELLRAA